MNRIFIATLVCLSLLAGCSKDGAVSNINLNSPEHTTSPGDSNN